MSVSVCSFPVCPSEALAHLCRLKLQIFAFLDFVSKFSELRTQAPVRFESNWSAAREGEPRDKVDFTAAVGACAFTNHE